MVATTHPVYLLFYSWSVQMIRTDYTELTSLLH